MLITLKNQNGGGVKCLNNNDDVRILFYLCIPKSECIFKIVNILYRMFGGWKMLSDCG